MPKTQADKVEYEGVITMYNGTVQGRLVQANEQHQYWIRIKEKGEWGKWFRMLGATSLIKIDKSDVMKYWAVKVTVKFLTSILDQRSITKFDIDAAKRAHMDFKTEAANTGKKIHDWAEQFALGKKPPIPEEDQVARGVGAFLDFIKKHKVKIIEPEKLLYSKKYNYCGMADAIIQIGKKYYILDYKASNALYQEVMLQTAGYALACEEMGDYKISGRFAVRFEKRSKEQFDEEMAEKNMLDATYDVFEYVYLDHDEKDLENDKAAFIAARNVTVWDKEAKKRMSDYKTKKTI